VQVLLPIIYFALRYSQVAMSREVLADTVGTQGLSGEPWSSRSVSLDEKISQFFNGNIYQFIHACVHAVKIVWDCAKSVD